MGRDGSLFHSADEIYAKQYLHHSPLRKSTRDLVTRHPRVVRRCPGQLRRLELPRLRTSCSELPGEQPGPRSNSPVWARNQLRNHYRIHSRRYALSYSCNPLMVTWGSGRVELELGGDRGGNGGLMVMGSVL